MAIPTGTTARQLRIPARWLPAAVVLLGLLTWWWPGYRAWGALSAGLVLSLALWVLWRIVAGDRTVPGHAFHAALVFPAIPVLYHVLRLSWDQTAATDALGGAMSVTLLYQLALLALGVLLVQSVFSDDSPPVLLPVLCSLTACFGAVAAIFWTPAGLPREGVALLACAGAVATIGAAGPLIESARVGAGVGKKAATVLLGGCAALLVAALVVAAGASERALHLTAAILGGCMLVGLGRGRLMRILCTCTVAGGLVAVLAYMVVRAVRAGDASMLLGRGEEALINATVDTAGLDVLIGAAGVPAVAGLAAVAALAAGLLLSQRPARRLARLRASCWAAAAGLSLAAMLSEGGLFIPAVTLAVATFWGLLPAMCDAPAPRRSGAWLPVVMVPLMLLMGLLPNPGLASWSVSALGGSARTLHAVTGFLLALVLVWVMGVRSVKLGLLGILLAVLAGLPGELLQGLVPERGAPLGAWLAVLTGDAGAGERAKVMSQVDDLFMHALGAVTVVVPYLLAMGSRWCESPDARALGGPGGKEVRKSSEQE